MKTEKQIKQRIKLLNNLLMKSSLCEEVKQLSIVEIEVLKWVLQK